MGLLSDHRPTASGGPGSLSCAGRNDSRPGGPGTRTAWWASLTHGAGQQGTRGPRGPGLAEDRSERSRASPGRIWEPGDLPMQVQRPSRAQGPRPERLRGRQALLGQKRAQQHKHRAVRTGRGARCSGTRRAGLPAWKPATCAEYDWSHVWSAACGRPRREPRLTGCRAGTESQAQVTEERALCMARPLAAGEEAAQGCSRRPGP